jgi:molecular chaperone DnaK (HSP70)
MLLQIPINIQKLSFDNINRKLLCKSVNLDEAAAIGATTQTECSLKLTELPLKLTEYSLKLTERSLKLTESG